MIFIHRALKYVKCYNAIRHEGREYRVTLPTDKCCSAHTSTSKVRPPMVSLQCHQHSTHPTKQNIWQVYLHTQPARLPITAHFSLQLFSRLACESWPVAEWHEKGLQGRHLCLVQQRASSSRYSTGLA